MSAITTPEELEPFLRLGSLDQTTVNRRVGPLAEDINRIGFKDFRLSARNCPFPDPITGQIIPVTLPEYYFGDTGFSVNNAENSSKNKIEWFGGTGIDRGHLQFLSRVSEIGHSVIPQYWLENKKLRDALRNPTQHLDTVEEVWWLSRWHGIESISMAERLLPNSKADVDWSFFLFNKQIRVNLEVKRIPSDLVRHTRGRPFNKEWFTTFCSEKVLPKFRPSGTDEINILGLSLFGEIDRNVQLVVSEWLRQHKCLIDAVVIVTREARGRSGLDKQIVNDKAQILNPFIKELDAEDSSLAFAFEVPIKVPGFPEASSQ